MLIVEDGTGVPNADSLASVEFADNYHNNRGNLTWQVITEPRKEQLLRVATDYIKYIFGPSLIGYKATSTQSLPFPRVISFVNIGNPISVQEATAELALIANTNSLIPTETTRRKKLVKVGPITVEYDGNSFTGPSFVAAISRLSEFLGASASGMTTRLVRV